MMRTRKPTWLLCLLAAVLNLGGGPMAWAQAVPTDTSASEAAPAAEMAPDCHPHSSAGADAADEPADDRSPPCCETGSCACVVPHGGPVADSLPLTGDSVSGPVCSAARRDVPSTIIDDALRPPIR
jgi:hypothetical protein